MDYSKLSDSEINHYVACQFPDVYQFNEHGAPYVLVPDTMAAYSGQDFEKVYFEPCANPADAWPIILQNNITILNDEGSFPSATNNCYMLIHEQYDDCIHELDKNPLRAAMIVFLKMNDA